MKPDPRFLGKPKQFWACVRSLSEQIGYTVRGKSLVFTPTLDDMTAAFERMGLDAGRLRSKSGRPNALGRSLAEYFRFRADVLNQEVEPSLMSSEEAERMYEQVKISLADQGAGAAVPMNKQSGVKRKPAYLTAMVNLLLRDSLSGLPCDYDPKALTTFTDKNLPLRTLARRVDGAFPSVKNPIAVWEIKEYYHTTTFGSRVADGVYETLLDGMELEELRKSEGIDCKHYLMIDAKYTWWDCGKSYLCRIVDMLHMGYVDEVLVGKQVIDRVPELGREWKTSFLKPRD